MGDMWNIFLDGDYGAAHVEPSTLFLAFMVAFVIGQAIGWIYMITHTTLSYSQTFVTSLVTIPVVVCLMMVLMSGSLVVAFGLLAVFAVVRFRNVLKDTRDTSFILWTIVEGMAAGTMRHTTAVMGLFVVGFVMLYLWATAFGSRLHFDAVLTLRVEDKTEESQESLTSILKHHASRITLTSQRRIPNSGIMHSYRLVLRDPARSEELEDDLSSETNCKDISLYMSDKESEV